MKSDSLRPGMRLTIAKKIALAVSGIVMFCVGTMAWVTSQNLKSGFITFLNQSQTQDLDQLGKVLEQRYRTLGNFDDLRHNRAAMRAVLEQVQPRGLIVEGERPRPRRGRGPQRNDRGDPGERGERGPGEGRPAPPRPPEAEPEPPGRAPDPMGFAARLSLSDEWGDPVIGPPDGGGAAGIVRPLLVDGRTVGKLTLAPLRAISGANDGAMAMSFVRGQIRDILLLSAILMAGAILLALGLARHLLRPVAALRGVTAKIAQGQFEARAPILNRDELSELAQHVNAMAQTLEQNEQRRRQMLADIAHELRTPLSVIRGEIEALLDGIRQVNPAALESLHVEVLRLNRLVDDVHQLALADAGALHCQRQSLDLRDLAQTVAKRYQARAAGLGLTLFASLPPRAIMIVGDSGRLAQVLMNLLENSCKYTDAKPDGSGKIALSLTRRGGFAEIAVEDSAPGVPPEAHARLFERLYRADQARTRERGGSGLGLSICKALIEAHEGRISAMPSALGGVKILIRLPLQSGHREDA